MLAVTANVAYSQNDNKSSNTKSHLVAGLVTDEETGGPIPGVTVVVQGKNIGTTTNANGEFRYPKELNEGETLVFSFIGLETQFYKVGPGANEDIRITMKGGSGIIIMEAAADNDVYAPKRKFIGSLKGWFK